MEAKNYSPDTQILSTQKKLTHDVAVGTFNLRDSTVTGERQSFDHKVLS